MEQLREDGFIFQIDEAERVLDIQESIKVRKYFTESASIPDLSPPKVGLYLIGFARDRADMLGIGVSTGTTTTKSARIKIKKTVSFGPVKLDRLIPNDDAGAHIRSYVDDHNKVRINSATFNIIINKIARLYPDKVDQIEKIIKIANGIDFEADEAKSYLFAQQQDALSSAFSGFNIRRPAYEDEWNFDEYDASTTYLDGFDLDDQWEHVTEDDIAIHDQKFFPEFVNDGAYNIKTNAFSDGRGVILVTMANRNAIEDVFGVDLIYFDAESESFCLIQYKRMELRGSKFVYYPRSDGNYEKDMRLMRRHTRTFGRYDAAALGDDINKYYDNYRLFGSPFFLKFVNSRVKFQPFQNKVLPGYYVSYDMWRSFVRERDQNGQTIKASADTLTKYIGVNHFCDLFRRGMIGSRRCSADAVTAVLAECLRGNRSAVFAYRSGIQEDEIGGDDGDD